MENFDIILDGSKKICIDSMVVVSEDSRYTIIDLFTTRHRNIGCVFLYLEKGALYTKFFNSYGNLYKFMKANNIEIE